MSIQIKSQGYLPAICLTKIYHSMPYTLESTYCYYGRNGLLLSEVQYLRLMTKTNSKTRSPKGVLIGYARVSTPEQSVDMQIEALERFGVDRGSIYSEALSATKAHRPQLQKAFRALRAGDTLVVWKLDRVARSLQNLLDIITRLEKKGAMFESLTDGIETKTPGGRFVLHVIGAFAQLERDLIAERTRAGIERAKRKGVKFGAEEKLKEADMPKVYKMVYQQGARRKDVAKEFGVSVQTISRRLKKYEKRVKAGNI